MSEPIAPSPEDANIAGESSQKLAHLAESLDAAVHVQIRSGRIEETIELPRGALQLLMQLLSEMSKGNAVTLTPIHAQLTTQQAAELLGVSRPFIIKELRNNKIPHQMVGTHRRILYKDLLEYKRKCRDTHNKAMDALVEQAQELGLGY